MTSPAKRKGDAAELEAAKLLADLTGWPIKRKLGAGRKEDTGDLYSLPDCVIQVKHYCDPQRAVREILAELPQQQANAGTTFAAGLVRRPGRRWAIVMTPEQFATLLREATGPLAQLAVMKPQPLESLQDPDITPEEAEAFDKAIREIR